ncbi:MAG: hypothetical protein ACON5F_08655 [Jejuia sp.]
MRIISLIIFQLITYISLGQNISRINKELKLPDSLNNTKEVRFYRGFGTTNNTTLLRIYQNKSKKWKVEFYEHWSMTNNEKGFNLTKKNLNPKTDIALIYAKLKLNYILDLPNMSEISWKFTKKGKIVKEKRKTNSKGDYKEEYIFSGRNKISILDGIGFKVQISDNKTNEFEFSNYEGYLKHFPNVDKLILYSEIVNILSEEFDIWKD